jgi:hypothetical protein
MRTSPPTVFSIATPQDADELARHMRAADRLEVALMHGHSPEVSAHSSLAVSDITFAARINGRLFCLFGAARLSLLDSTATAWMLCTDEVQRHPGRFIASCRQGYRILAATLPDVELFTNLVHDQNRTAIRWLEWSGAWFAPHAEDVQGRFGGVFKRFSISAEDAGKEGGRHVRNR